MRIWLFLLLSSTWLSMSEHTPKYPVGQFISPVNRDIKLSGTFGELRNNHFHAGLDIKSKNGTIGDTVYAAADGYISRIQVNEYGYGNVLYIEHPNGYTSVYAHLDCFAPLIQDFVKKEQYRKERFEVDLYPAPFQFPVRQLDQIGLLGNSGYSFGPHLHFEIRHSDSQTPVNPLHFGISVQDQTPPVIQQLIAYQYDPAGQLLNSIVLQPKVKSKGVYVLEQPVEIAGTQVTFGIRTCDYQDGVDNQNGVYSIACKADDAPSFAFALDEIAFRYSRYLNAHIDYRMKVYQNKFFHRCFPLEGNKLPIYFTGVDEGLIYLHTEQPREVSIAVADFNNNVSTVEFAVQRNTSLLLNYAPEPVFQQMATPGEMAIISQPGIQVVWPEGSFYEKTPLNITTIPGAETDAFSPHYELAPTDVPVHYYFTIAIEGLNVPPAFQDKAFIARCDPDGSVVNCGGNWIGNNLTSGARQMGTYTIMIDTIPPTISPLSFNAKMKAWKKMSFRISDNVRIRDKGRDLLYSAWVDGKWILMALDGKNGVLTHEFDGRIPPGDHELVLKVTDDRGNEAVLRKSFTL